MLLAGLCFSCFFICRGTGYEKEEAIGSALAYMYFLSWVSVSNCTFYISEECKVLNAGYYLNWCAPFTLIALACIEECFGCAESLIWLPLLVYGISIILFIIAVTWIMDPIYTC